MAKVLSLALVRPIICTTEHFAEGKGIEPSASQPRWPGFQSQFVPFVATFHVEPACGLTSRVLLVSSPRGASTLISSGGDVA